MTPRFEIMWMWESVHSDFVDDFFLLSLYCLFTPYVYSYIIWQMIYELSVYIEKYTPLTLYISIIYKLYSWEQVDSSQLGHSTVNRWFSLLWHSHPRRKWINLILGILKDTSSAAFLIEIQKKTSLAANSIKKTTCIDYREEKSSYFHYCPLNLICMCQVLFMRTARQLALSILL